MRDRAVHHITEECAALVSNVRSFSKSEHSAGKSTALNIGPNGQKRIARTLQTSCMFGGRFSLCEQT